MSGPCVWMLVLGVACGDPVKDTDTPPVEAGDTDTGGDPDDADGDGFTPEGGDCDDADATVHPDAVETPGDRIDQDCDGSDFVATPIADFGARVEGSIPGMGFGKVVALDEPEDDRAPVVLISAPALGVGEYGGTGEVHVYTSEEAAIGTAGTVIHDEALTETSFGQAIAALRLAEGSRAWMVGFSATGDQGGFCAWEDTHVGTVGLSEADACIPPFGDVYDRAGFGFSAAADLDGDGFDELVTSGMADLDGEPAGAMWITWGPLDFAVLGEAPTVGLAGSSSSPSVHAPGDLTGDGYADLVLADEGAETTEASSGRVYVLPGGGGVTESWEALDGVDGDRPAASTGRAVAGPDLDADGQADLCVSAALDDTVGERAGRVGCFYGPFAGRHALGAADVTSTAEGPNAFYGSAMGALDVDGDGDDELAVGAPSEFGDGWPGKVYLLDPTSPTPVGLLSAEPGDTLGVALATGDLDGDGRDDLVVGAPTASGGRGSAYVVLGSDGAW